MATETMKHSDMKVGFETLRDDMHQLTDDFKEVLHTVGERSRDAIAERKGKMGSAVKSWSERTKDRACDTYERINNRSKEAVEKSRGKIALKPFTSVFAALAAGILLGAILGRR
jgi:ElaB/YqjD/DUF883 family membrane-anchored ribosome-binding protein